MNALQKIQTTAGQKLHEKLYEATWEWGTLKLPCTHGDINQNPPLQPDGWSPNTMVTVTVRTELFGDLRPNKGDPCILNSVDQIFKLQVQMVTSVVGDPFLKLLCVDEHEAN